MSEGTSQLSGPDFAQGLALAQLADGAMLLGHVGEQPVLLARRGREVFAIDAACTHYGGPLAEGLLVDDTVRCPWHHACFSLRTGEALRPPALNAVACWRVERRGDRIFVREKAAVVVPKPAPLPAAGVPGSIVILGGGAAGNSAAEALCREGYAGSILMLSADSSVPYDRPNLSKDYLAGNASEEWIPLRSPEFYREHRVELRLGARATAIDAARREIRLEDGSRLAYGALLIATGAEPVRLDVPGGDLPHVHTLRSLADSRAIIEKAKGAQRAVVIGASFIGLEVAASLRARQIEVHIVAPELIPMERILGPEIGGLVRRIHLVERNGRVRSWKIDRVDGATLKGAIRENVDRKSRIVTDEWRSYIGIGKEFEGGHEVVLHSASEYARDDMNTNTVESYFALLKRGVVGSFHHVSKEHLDRYCDEFSFRWNRRDMDDTERAAAIVAGGIGKRLTYRRPRGAQQAPP
jgi:nitrite reductase/ring-hydroxylating ferredoxin subunit/thioredoxin reductase